MPFLSTAALLSSLAAALAGPLRPDVARRGAAGPAAPPPKSALLQAAGAADKPAFNVPFFSEDADAMAEMPPYLPDPAAHEDWPGDPICKPRCQYTCGHRECDQACEPLCLPPQCETLCAKSEDKCETRCAKPKCAVICPTQDCVNGDCPKCRTICSPPACTTSCSGSCHSVCTQPQCSWKCKVGKCPKPECKMACSGFKQCHEKLPDRNLTKVPLMPGMDVKSRDRASLDPTVLTQPAQAPPPEGWRAVPTRHPESSMGYLDVPKPKTISPVAALKMRWDAEDLVAENARLLRR